MSTQSLSVAIIGGGAAGLAAARILSRNGIHPVVFEKEQSVGGVWDYRACDPTRPMYRGLRTNLPRDIMAYREKPWPTPCGEKSFVTHEDVFLYLNEYKKEFNLDHFIKYGSKVVQLSVLLDQSSQVNVMGEMLPKIRLEWEENSDAETKSGIFDAVCIANGHYAMPNIPYLEGLENNQSRTMHSIEYDSPECFSGETVLCIGGRASGSDLAKEISHYASHVYLSDSKVHVAETQGNVTFVPRSIAIGADGCIAFSDGCRIRPKVDTIIFCTGYDYHFPFINDKSNLELSAIPGERRVMPLYKQLWHTDHPNLSFIGLPHSVVPFPLFELQAEAIVQQMLSCGKDLPLKLERRKQGKNDAEAGGAELKGNVKDTHYLGPAQWDYCRQLAIIAHEYDDDVENFISTNRVSFNFAFILY